MPLTSSFRVSNTADGALGQRCGRALRLHCGVAPGAPLVAACSGGADSVALVHALADAGHPMVVAFVDHGLRDVSAERDAARAAATTVGASFVVKELSLQPGANLQARARAARYAALEAVASHDIALGHTMSDRAETVLARLLRGAGPHGLAAMPWRNGRLVRPLLDVSRAETRASGHPFVDDPSNTSTTYQRNRLRLDIMPRLVAENPAIERVLAELADQLSGQRALIDVLLVDLDLRDRETPLIEAYLRARVAAEGCTPRGEALSAWAAALRAGTDGSFALGGDLIGLARAGCAGFRRVMDPRGRIVAWGPGTYRRGHVRMEIVRAAMTATPLACDHCFAPVSEADIVWPLALEAGIDASHLGVHRVVDGTGDLLGSSRPTSPISEGIDARDGRTMAIHVGISNDPNGDVVAEDEGTLPLNG